MRTDTTVTQREKDYDEGLEATHTWSEKSGIRARLRSRSKKYALER